MDKSIKTATDERNANTNKNSLTQEQEQEYLRQIKENSSLLSIILKSMGGECQDCLYSMFSAQNILKVLDDKELMLSARVLFDNNLSIGDASKQIYIHRNTMVYRIEKIERLTGLDIRKFDEAMALCALINLYDNIKK